VNAGGERVPVTVVIPTLNEGERIRGALASVAWAAEVIVADGGSTDDTVAVARASGAITLEGTGPTIGAQRNAAIDRATQDWILALDADERATPALRDQLKRDLPNARCAAYRFRRENTYLGRTMRYGRFGRDWHLCVFRRDQRYTAARVHEGVRVSGEVGRLDGPILHTPYRDLAHHARKIVQYAEWAAADRAGRGGGGTGSLLIKPTLRVARDLIVYSGWRDGWRGVVAAAMSGYSVFLRAALLREQRPDRSG
jgi:glycosyltransferase involved in cell wall biosynthesis